MSTLTSFLPILFVIVLVIFIFFIMRQLSKAVKWTISSPKITVAILSVYILVGLVLMVVLSQQQSGTPILSDEELMKISKEEELINRAIDNAAYTDIDEKYIEETWEYELQGDSITIEYLNNTNGYLPIYVEQRREEDDRSVYVTYYRTPHIFEGLDVTKYVKTPTVSFEQDTFSVIWGDGGVYRFHQIIPRIAIIDSKFEQFESNNPRDRNYGKQVLYLNIPKDVHIIDRSME